MISERLYSPLRLVIFSAFLATFGLLNSCVNDTETLTGDAIFESFGINELPATEFTLDHETGIISVNNPSQLDPELDATHLTAYFEVSPGAGVFVGDTRQTSGDTANDFSDGLTYTVVSEDGHVINNYFVHLEESVPMTYLLEGSIGTDVNPYEISPLSAYAYLKTKKESRVSYRVLGEEEYSHSLSEYRTSHEVSVLGLYAGFKNQIEFTLTDHNGVQVRDTVSIQTAALPEFFPEVEINTIQSNRMESGFHFSEFNVGNSGRFNSYPFIFDNHGDVRWFIDLSQFDRLVWAVEFNDDGSFFGVYGVTIIEFDKMGRERNRIVVEGYNMHHEVLRLPSGNYVVAVTKEGTTMVKNGEERSSVEDFIIEVDPAGNVVNEWDMAEVLDVNRTVLLDGGNDWFHMNAIWYDESDHSLIVSGRNQGVVKVNWENELQWILAPHKEWGTAGRTGEGHETSPYLLTAVDNSGQPFDESVQQGDTELNEFSWTWGQHTPILLPNGNLFVFDNGLNRNFGSASNYSLAIEYQIDEDNNTVRQVWSYGRERGNETFSNIISNVGHFPETGNRLFAPGLITFPDNSSKIIEVSYPDGEVIFESTLLFKNLLGNQQGWGEIDITYRANRVPLIPPH